MDVVAVIVTYNRKAMLMQCLQSVLAQEDMAPDILIVDNASTDGTLQSISDYLDNPIVTYCNTGSNLGGAGGFQFGIRRALSLKYKYLWLMDDDCIPEPDALSALLKAHERYRGAYGFLCSKVKWTDGTLCNMNRQRVSLTRYVDSDEKRDRRVIMSSFVSFFTKAETVQKYGLPIKEFFIWADDLEYSRRISISEPCYYIPDSRVVHRMKSNEKVGIERDDISRLWRYDYLYRNEYYLYSREGLKGRCYLLIRLFLHSLRVISSSESERLKRLRTIWRSCLSGFRFHPEIEWQDEGHS